MKYPNLTQDRKKFIDGLTRSLFDDYGRGKDAKLEKLGEDRGITFLRDDRFVTPFTTYLGPLGLDTYVVCLPRSFEHPITTAHEIGHVILNHLTNEGESDVVEDEAWYFSQRMTGKAVDLDFYSAYQDFLKTVNPTYVEMEELPLEELSEYRARIIMGYLLQDEK
ncbi:MAG: hypothetical protein ABIF40_01710 [archaeon]